MLFLLLVQFLIFNSCIIQENPENLEVINAYIDEYVNNQKFDKRLYDPPTAPWRDIEQHNGKMKPDSIIENLKPLKIYINVEVKYDSTFMVNKRPKSGYDFIKKMKPINKSFPLEGKRFDKKEGVILEFLSSEAFFKKHKKIQYNQAYGGFVSFRNLYYSKDCKKAIFKIDFYKRRLNSSSSIIYAEKQSDGTWKFESELLSIS